MNLKELSGKRKDASKKLREGWGRALVGDAKEENNM